MSDNNITEQTQDQQTPNGQQPPTTAHAEQTNYKELYIRLAADLQNFKRRVEKERLEWTDAAQGIILSAFLPIIEDFDRAIETATQHNQHECDCPKTEHLEGLKLIHKNLKKTLTDLGVNEIDTTGKFDPEYHEALAQVDIQDKQSGSIVQTFSKGYMFKGKVLKHAQVSVTK